MCERDGEREKGMRAECVCVREGGGGGRKMGRERKLYVGRLKKKKKKSEKQGAMAAVVSVLVVTRFHSYLFIQRVSFTSEHCSARFDLSPP